MKKAFFEALVLLLFTFSLSAQTYPWTPEENDASIVEPIVNGTETGYNEYKGVVGLFINMGNGYGSICTATLLDPEVVLTAGHCVYINDGESDFNAVSNPSIIQVFGGANMNTGDYFAYGKASKIIKHPTWSGDINNTSSQNVDLALIKMTKAINGVQYYGIRSQTVESIGTTGIIVGYGLTKTNGNDSGVHRKGNAQVLYKGTYGSGSNSKYLIEVGSPSGTCQGDSGGPFFTQEGGNLVVSGVTSFGGQVCYADRDGYDTHVYYYKDWIKSTFKELTGRDMPVISSSGSYCGDGTTDSNEICDSNTLDCSAISSSYASGTTISCKNDCSGYDVSLCKAKPVCGDGKVTGDELCDSDSKPCTAFNFPNSTKTAYCKSDCSGYNYAVCDSTGSTTVCGNGNIEYGETCDDGNTKSGDGCSSTCQEEIYIGASDSCGDGVRDSNEQCDDGNMMPGDGCDPLCRNESPVAGTSTCGNTILEYGETCDDGNMMPGDGCDPLCRSERLKDSSESTRTSGCSMSFID